MSVLWLGLIYAAMEAKMAAGEMERPLLRPLSGDGGYKDLAH